MIVRLKIENFKSIGSPGLDLDLKPLTVFVGPNGSGKSNILQALALVGHKVDRGYADFDPDDTAITKTPDVVDTIHKQDPRRWLTIEVHMRVDESEAARLADMFVPINEQKLGLKMIKSFDMIGHRFSYKRENNETQQSVFMGGEEIARVSHLYNLKMRGWQSKFEYPKPMEGVPSSQSANDILASRVFKHAGEVSEELRALTDLSEEIVMVAATKLRDKVFLLSALRGDLPYSPETGRPPSWVGMKGENIVHILSLVGRRKYKEKRQKIAKWAERFGLVDVTGTWSGYNKLESDYADPELGTALNSALAGSGSRQVLSVIVQLFWSNLGDVIMVEEPEISLHPDSQALLPELFADATQEGKQVIVTTHSEFLLLALSKPIRAGLIKPTDIAIYHIDKDLKGTSGKKLELTEKGYVKGWVKSFAEAERALFKEWLATVPKEE